MLWQQLLLVVIATSLAACTAATQRDGPLDNNYKLKFIDTAKHPLAVCNDGSPGAYYVHDGTCPRKTFVIHQQGGWWCWDDYSCKVRWEHFLPTKRAPTEKRHLMSSKSLLQTTNAYNTFNGAIDTG